MLLFAVSNLLAHESGLITVTVLGIWLTNQRDFDIEHIIEFKENLRTLLIGCLFIVLGSRVDVADVIAIGWPGLFFVALLILAVRPLSVLISLLGSPLNLREQIFIAGMAPRGIVAAAVSSVFALEIERHSEHAAGPGCGSVGDRDVSGHRGDRRRLRSGGGTAGQSVGIGRAEDQRGADRWGRPVGARVCDRTEKIRTSPSFWSTATTTRSPRRESQDSMRCARTS